MTDQRTYWHLSSENRIPSEYEIVSSKLLYYPGRGFEVNTPIADWYRRYQQGSTIRCADWERFCDPRQTTYAGYIALKAKQEGHLDELFQFIETSRYDGTLSPSWIEKLDRFFAPLRYPFHGFQMIAAYVGQMATSGKIVIASLLQSADEMRRIQRVARRIAQLRHSFPDFGKDGKFRWEKDPAFQPLREVVERLLVTYDWTEAFVALNHVLKPALDTFLFPTLAQLARECGDSVLGEILHSFHEDSMWQRQWTQVLTTILIEDNADNQPVFEQCTKKWRPLADEAIKALAAAYR